MRGLGIVIMEVWSMGMWMARVRRMGIESVGMGIVMRMGITSPGIAVAMARGVA